MSLDRFSMARREFRDARTGRSVWQITDGPFECVAPYMEIKAWTPDDRCLFFMCNRTGTWQPYVLTLATGDARQLFACVGAMFRSIAYEPNRGEVYVQHRGQYVAVNPDTLAWRVAATYDPAPELAPPGKGSAAVLSSDGTLIAVGLISPEGRPAIRVCRTDGSGDGWTVIIRKDALGCPGHLNFRPGDNTCISCCGATDRQNDPAETPFRRAREYRVELRTGEVEPLVLMPPGFRATHCTWGASGRRIYTHRKTVPGWLPTALCSLDDHGADLRVHYETDLYRLGHSQPSPGEKWLVTDSQDPDTNILLLAHTARNEQHLLAWPNMSITSCRPDRRSPQLPAHTDRHTHPGFSLSGRFVHYTSDVSGCSQVYVVPVSDVVRPGE